MHSIPKLELCSALLLSRLTVKFLRALDLPLFEIFLFTDSFTDSYLQGLWEAAVKSVKHHLHIIVGDHALTFEEFYTLI